MPTLQVCVRVSSPFPPPATLGRQTRSHRKVAERLVSVGVRGYLLKNTEADELLRAIHNVASGGAIFSPGIAQQALGYLNAPEPDLPARIFDELTPRERQILELIAQTLNLSPKTVSNNLPNVLPKVQATERAKLMLMALDAGMGKLGRSA